MKKLQRKIMRGIYFAYALRLVSLRGVPQGFLMLGALIALTHFVSLGNVIYNFRNLESGRTSEFFYNAISTTEAWTLVLIGLLVFMTLSLRFTLRMPSQYKYVRA